MSETKIQIADSPSDPEGSPAGTPQSLWVPLVIVPAGIVLAVVVIFALFGGLAGEERSIAANLELVVHGGKNGREQALFNLMRQVSENQKARIEGQEPPWSLEVGFVDDVRAAIEATDEDEYRTRVALAALLAGVDPSGVDLLIGMLSLTEAQDPQGKLRFQVIQNLGLIGDGRASAPLIPFLDSPDEGLRTLTALALASVPGEGVREALEGSLEDSSLEVRGTAAISLSKLDPPSARGAAVLKDLTDLASYEAVREQDRTKFTNASDVSKTRIIALRALARLGRPEDWAHVESLRSDPDSNVVDAVLTLIRERDQG